MALPTHTGYNFTHTLHNDIYPSIDPSKTDLSQPGKVVLITGSGRGIGRAIALLFAESSVACIILCARTTSDLDEVEQSIKNISTDVRVWKYAVDIAAEPAVLAMAESVRNQEGRLDVLINNAGILDKWTTVTEGDSELYAKTLDVNLKGTYFMLRSFLPLMVETAKSYAVAVDVINMTSIAAHFVMARSTAYQVSKLALVRLSELVVEEYGDQGVNCLSLHPGGVSTGIMGQEQIPFILPGEYMWSIAHYTREQAMLTCRFKSTDRHAGSLRGISCMAYQGATGVAQRSLFKCDLGCRWIGCQERWDN